MYKIAVCDSNVADAQTLVNTIQQLAADASFVCAVESFRTARGLTEAMKKEPYRFIFLETEIGGTNGIELAKRLRFQNEETEFVFVTSHAEYALAAYAVYPAAYLLKDITVQKLYEPFMRILKRERKGSPCLAIATADGGETLVERNDLLYVEVFGNKLFYHLKDETVESVGTLAGVLAKLPAESFYRSHRNFIVNLQYVQRIGHFFFGLQNGEKIAVAKNRYTEAKAVLERRLTV
jgi:DNA-binding LytR/AlgR family response regulator